MLTPDHSRILDRLALSVYQILKRNDHPFTVIGCAAHRWMGARGSPDCTIDILLRDGQLATIAAALEQSGDWSYYDAPGERQKLEEEGELVDMFVQKFADELIEPDIVLELKCDSVDLAFFRYLKLWSETSYKLRVDEVSWLGVPCLVHGNAILVEERYNPVPDRTDGWATGPLLMSAYSDRYYCAGKLNDNSILIPALPSYLNALVYHVNHYRHSKPQLAFYSSWQIRNLTRYLYLEQPNRRIEILFEVEAETEPYLERYFAEYQRKPRIVALLDGTTLQVENTSVCKKGRITSDHQIVPYPGLEYLT